MSDNAVSAAWVLRGDCDFKRRLVCRIEWSLLRLDVGPRHRRAALQMLLRGRDAAGLRRDALDPVFVNVDVGLDRAALVRFAGSGSEGRCALVTAPVSGGLTTAAFGRGLVVGSFPPCPPAVGFGSDGRAPGRRSIIVVVVPFWLSCVSAQLWMPSFITPVSFGKSIGEPSPARLPYVRTILLGRVEIPFFRVIP